MEPSNGSPAPNQARGACCTQISEMNLSAFVALAEELATYVLEGASRVVRAQPTVAVTASPNSEAALCVLRCSCWALEFASITNERGAPGKQ